MTDPAQTAARHFDDIEDVFALLRAEGHRVTMPCRIVLEGLFAAEGPVSAPHIAKMTPLDSDMSSVYRNLERLEGLGIVRHVHLGHGPSLYMLVGEGEREFLLCERCGRVRSVDPAELEEVRDQIRERFGYRASFGHFPIIGLCARCEKGGEEDPDSASAHTHGEYVHTHLHPARADEAHPHEHDRRRRTEEAGDA